MKQINGLGNEALVLTTSKCLTLLISMVSAMLLSRFRSLEEYGTYSQLLLVINLVSSLMMLGLPNCINYFLVRAETQAEKSQFLSVYYTLSTLLSALVGGILVLSTPLIVHYFKNPSIHSYVYFLAVFPWTRIIMGSIENILIVSGHTKFLTGYRIANSLSLLGILLFVQVFGLTFQHYIALYLLIEVLFSIWVYFIAKGIAQKLFLSVDRTTISAILRFSIPIGLAAMVGTVSIELDKLVIGAFLDTESLALYANAGRELPITIISSSITAVLMPRIIRLIKSENAKAAIALWKDSIVISYGVICFFVAAMVVFAPQVISLLYSPKYLPAVGVFRIYNIVLLLRCTYFGMILNSMGKTKLIMYSSILSLALNLGLNVICLKLMGFVGPAIATFLSILTIALYQLIFTARVLHISFAEVFPWRRLLGLTLLNGVLGLGMYQISRFLRLTFTARDIAIAIALGLIWSALYIILCFRKGKALWIHVNSIE